jgi:hypothetical protein
VVAFFDTCFSHTRDFYSLWLTYPMLNSP